MDWPRRRSDICSLDRLGQQGCHLKFAFFKTYPMRPSPLIGSAAVSLKRVRRKRFKHGRMSDYDIMLLDFCSSRVPPTFVLSDIGCGPEAIVEPSRENFEIFEDPLSVPRRDTREWAAALSRELKVEIANLHRTVNGVDPDKVIRCQAHGS